jgi:HPt (histidine-containing phosphotransfer) domain-containing protein
MSGTPVDFDYLETYAAGDREVVSEVLGLFRAQAQAWRGRLAEPGADWRDLVHTIKGSARGIGATALAEVCERAEQGDTTLAPQVQAALAQADAAIEGYLTRIGGG